MNRTHFEHAIYAILMQIAVALITGNWVTGAAFGVAFFMGREHAQAEDRVIQATKKAPVRFPEFHAFHPKYWSLDAVLDWVFPILGVAAMLTALVAGCPRLKTSMPC